MLSFSINYDILSIIFTKQGLEKPGSVKELSGGYANPALLINNKYVIRFNSGKSKTGDDSRESCFPREAVLYPLLAKHGIPTPSNIAMDTTKVLLPYNYIINTYLPGDILSQVYLSLDEHARRSIARQAGQLLREIHAITKEQISDRELFTWRLPWTEIFINKFAELYTTFQDHNNMLSIEQKKTVERVYTSFQENITDADIPFGLLHNDFHANHIVVRDGEIVGFIDFEWASIGDPLYDLQKLPVNLSIPGLFETKVFLSGYGKETFTDNERIRFNMYCLEQAIWQIDRTSHGKHGFPEEGIHSGYALLNAISEF